MTLKTGVIGYGMTDGKKTGHLAITLECDLVKQGNGNTCVTVRHKDTIWVVYRKGLNSAPEAVVAAVRTWAGWDK